ncbi:hypothetical protein LNAOJCKE_2979 [Methylorubrum aminovorans]|uniref:Uncharacterized protein n=1 Tax=Methylorubrum aminovorans TaxID=269069 RepID=A0ABQ4UGE6_9HYPH|nr:hypothetical protein [Methylorubrum aminovorans]GJE65766.1 hypothetical protein LNAOJCKE_2979 [Methylorubrum aminovorans]GMA75882.1 hypothetical protein GCM10025880_22990 [Methylorubrum aminovorans]
MPRQPRQVAGIGASDLPNQAAVAAYTGPPRELVVGVDTLRFHDGFTPGGIPLAKGGHTLVEDADYQCLSSDVQVGLKPLTSPRTISLPDVDLFPLGQDLVIADESGACSDVLTITIKPGPSTGDVIGGPEGAATIVLSSPYQAVRFRRGASNLWIRL